MKGSNLGTELSGRGGSSSGHAKDYGTRSPEFDSCWDLSIISFLLFSTSLNQLCILKTGTS